MIVIQILFLILPTNLTIKIVFNKSMPQNFTQLELQDYYQNLDRIEKSNLLNYLQVNFDYKYVSIQNKMTGKAKMNKRDLIIISGVINDQTWKL